MDVLDSLRNTLREKGISEGQFAERIGYSPSHFSMIMNHQRRYYPDFLKAVIKEIPEFITVVIYYYSN